MKVNAMEIFSMTTQEFYDYGYVSNMVAMATVACLLYKMSSDLEDRMYYYDLLINKKYLKRMKML